MNRKVLFIVLPALLIITTLPVFYFISLLFGKDLGTVVGMVFYWLFWCLIIPISIYKKDIFSLFKNKQALFLKKNWWVIVLFLSTIITPIFIYNTFANIISKPLLLIILSIPLAILNGFFEELFWRGLFIRQFPKSILWGILIPSIFFSLWHIAPSIIHENQFIFVLSTFPLGLVYGIVAFTTKSAKWSAIGHSISGILAIGGSVALSFYTLFF